MRLLLVLALGLGLLVATPAAAATPPDRIVTGQGLVAGQRLVSAHGRFTAAVEPSGTFAVRAASGGAFWHTPPVGAGARLSLGRTGGIVVSSPHGSWSALTGGSSADTFVLGDDGVLTLTARGLLVWSSRIGNGCPWSRGALFTVDISAQFARACYRGRQLRATPVTTGAPARGDGTPTGTWRVQARIRDTVLRPASGGAYPVHYWVPYDGAYGLHDSPWQRFPYGSGQYRWHGSHGCTHVPAAMMAWLFGWVRVGSTTITIHA